MKKSCSLVSQEALTLVPTEARGSVNQSFVVGYEGRWEVLASFSPGGLTGLVMLEFIGVKKEDTSA